ICGGSVIGLTAAMMLARDGHEVDVIEADPAPVPKLAADAWDAWPRTGVAQFHQPHNLFARVRDIVDADLPGMTEALVDAGCVWGDPVGGLPPFITDREPRVGDDRLRFVTGRRPVIEATFARAADNSTGVTIRRGCAVTGLLTGASATDTAP